MAHPTVWSWCVSDQAPHSKVMSEPPACLQQESNQLSLARTPPWLWNFPSGSVVKNRPANAGDVGSIPGLGRSPREGNGKLFQYSCLENPIDRGVWQSHRSQKRLKNSNNNNSLAINSHFFPPYSELSLTFPPPPPPPSPSVTAKSRWWFLPLLPQSLWVCLTVPWINVSLIRGRKGFYPIWAGAVKEGLQSLPEHGAENIE